MTTAPTTTVDDGEGLIVRSLIVALTSDQLANGIANALRDHHIDYIPYYFAALVVVDPQMATDIRDTIRVAGLIKAEQEAAAGGDPL